MMEIDEELNWRQNILPGAIYAMLFRYQDLMATL